MDVNVKTINNLISKVYKDSIADEIGIEVGDILVLDTRVDEELTCFVENKKIGTASAGIHKGKAAVIINNILDW